MVNLTAGAIKKIITSDGDDMPPSPVLQILGVKKLQASKGVDRYRVVLSDGVNYYTSGMIGTQLNDMIQEESLDSRAVVQLDRYTCNIVQNARKVIVILDMKIVKKATEVPAKIGTPEQVSDQLSVIEELAKEMKNAAGVQKNTTQQQGNNFNERKPAFGGQQQQNRGFGNGAAQPKPNPYGAGAGSAFYGGGSKMQNKPGGGSTVVHPISSLTPYQNRVFSTSLYQPKAWTIRARVTNKSGIRTWSNSKGEGKLFSLDLLDESGEIKATGFHEAVDRFYEKIEIGKVYFITKGSLRTANKQYSSLKNDYEMYINNDTSIELCEEKVDLPQVQFNFVNIGDLESVNKDALVDIIGVVKSAQDVMQITTRATNRQVSKRDLSVVDRSETAVNVTLWGEQAEKFDEHVDKSPVVAIKGAKVSDFGGRSLSVLNSSLFHINPDIPEAHTLRGWYDQVGKDAGVKSISGQRSDGGISGQFKTIAQMKAENLGMGDKPDYFSLRGTVVFFKKDNCLYKACPSAECNKKVVDEGGEYRCEKCNRSYPNFKYRLIMSTNICDCTGNQWVTAFQESGEAILGTTAENIGRLKDEDETAFDDVFSEASFKAFNFKFRAKVEVYNDESRFKVSCVTAVPLDFVADSKRLLEDIKKLEAL